MITLLAFATVAALLAVALLRRGPPSHDGSTARFLEHSAGRGCAMLVLLVVGLMFLIFAFLVLVPGRGSIWSS